MNSYRTWEFGLRKRVFGKQYGGWPRYFPLYLTRGCGHGCDYCPYPVAYGARVLRKSLEQVAAEFAAVARAGTTRVLLRDQSIGDDLGYLVEFCEALRRTRLGVEWLCEARLGAFDHSVLKLMSSAGCVRIHYGLETGDPAIFHQHAKPGASLGHAHDTVQWTRDAGIVPSFHVLVGFPQESWTSVSRTVGLIRDLGVSEGDCAVLTPYPGTRYHRRMIEENRLLSCDWSDYSGVNPVVRVDGLPPSQLALARRAIIAAITSNGPHTLRRRLRAALSSWRDPARGERDLAGLVAQPDYASPARPHLSCGTSEGERGHEPCATPVKA